jgi:hypothetical protein
MCFDIGSPSDMDLQAWEFGFCICVYAQMVHIR